MLSRPDEDIGPYTLIVRLWFDMKIRLAEKEDLAVVAKLAAELWPDHTAEELAEELTLLNEAESALFLAEEECPLGFAQCQLRHDYVEGTEHSPVGYLEGIYVRENYRHRGVARELLAACESWAKEQGCVEFASDCELGNSMSLEFHLSVGFEEANRIICFTKKLDR